MSARIIDENQKMYHIVINSYESGDNYRMRDPDNCFVVDIECDSGEEAVIAAFEKFTKSKFFYVPESVPSTTGKALNVLCWKTKG